MKGCLPPSREERGPIVFVPWETSASFRHPACLEELCEEGKGDKDVKKRHVLEYL